MPHSHLVMRKRACLVRTDYSARAKGFHAWQFPYQSIAFDHALHAQGQRYRDNSRQTFRDGCYCKSNRCQKHLKCRLAIKDTCSKYDQSDNDNTDSQNLAKACKLFLQWGRRCLCFLDQLCDLANLSIHSCSNDSRLTTTVSDDGAGEDHVFLVCHSNMVMKSFYFLVHWRRLTCKCSLLRGKIRKLNQTAVSRNLVACL